MNESPRSKSKPAGPPLVWPQLLLRTAAALGAIISSGPADAGRPVPVLQDTTYRSVSEFGPDTLLVRELVFDAPVLSAEIDESSGCLVVAARTMVRSNSRSISATDEEQVRLLAYDLQAHRLMWEKTSPLIPVALAGGRALLFKDDQRYSLMRVEDGQQLANINGQPFVWSDGFALRITDGAVIRWELESGIDLWEFGRKIGGNLDRVIRQDSVAYLVADGIQKLDLLRGPLWSYSIQASRKGLYANPDGEIVQIPSGYGGSRATNLTAAPLFRDDDIYFAADTTVVKLDARSGEVLWRRHLPRPQDLSLKQRALGTRGGAQFLGRMVVRDAGRNVLVASLGWASGPKHDLWADPPTVALLAKSDGHVIARAQIPGVSFLNDALSTPFGNYVLTLDRVVALDDSLRARAAFEAPMSFRPLGHFIEIGDALVLTIGPGIAALSSDSMGVVWSRRCGRTLAIESDFFGSAARYCVSTQGLIRLDKRAGLQPNAYYPLRSSWAEIREGWLVMGAGTTVRVVALLARQPAPRAD